MAIAMERDPHIGAAVVGAPPARRLIRLHRHSLSHLLLVGGTAEERERLAREFHRGSPLRRGPFVRLDADHEALRLCCALVNVLCAVTGERHDDPLRASEGGTLFLDRVTHLSPAIQRLLFHVLASPPVVSASPYFGRLAVGSDEPPEDVAAVGRFLPELFDILDKVRVDLPAVVGRGAR